MATQVATLVVETRTEQVVEADKRLDKLSKTADKAATSVKNMGQNMRLTRGPTSALSTTSGQLAVQFQDVAVQAGMGTSALRIFGQQAPQILSVFGPKGAVLGAVAAIGAAVLSVIIPSFGKSKDTLKEFTDSVETVGKSVEDLTNDFFSLSKSLVDLAQKSEAAARLQIAIALDAADIAAKRARESFDRLGLTGQGMNRSLKEGGQAARDFAVALENLSRDDRSAAALSVIKRAADALGVSIQDITGIHEIYLKAIDPNADGAAMVAFAEKLAELAINSKDPAFRSFAENLLDIAMKAETTEERARLLTQAMSDFAGVASLADQKTVDFVERLKEMASEAGKTREKILAMQVAQITDPKAREEAQKYLDHIINVGKIEKEISAEAEAMKKAEADAVKKASEEAQAAAAERKRQASEDLLVLKLQDEMAKEKEKKAEEAAKKEAERINQQMDLRRQLLKMAADLQEQEAREKERIEKENAARMAEFERERLREQADVNASFLALEDKLMSGKTEKQKAGFRTLVNIMNEEKRARAIEIVSNSYNAAMKAWGALASIPIVGPFLGAAAAGTIIAAGASYAAASLSGRALGGQVRSGESYVVGERGPEVLTMGGSGRVIPNDKLNGAKQAPKTTNVNVSFNIQANDTTGFDQLLQSRRGQIVGIINQALNDQGRRAIA
jgi:hypothetical protein